MPSSFNHGTDVLGTSATEVYTCPPGTTAIVIGMWMKNVNDSVAQTVLVTREYAALSQTRELTEADLPPRGSFSPMQEIGKMVLKAGDKIYGQCTSANQVEMGIEVMELT